jgi:hypothetical protein
METKKERDSSVVIVVIVVLPPPRFLYSFLLLRSACRMKAKTASHTPEQISSQGTVKKNVKRRGEAHHVTRLTIRRITSLHRNIHLHK